MEKLESGREVELTKRDLKILQKDETKVLEGFAEIKIAIRTLEEELVAANTRKQSYENNVMSLLQKDPNDSQSLAQQNAIEAEREEEQIQVLQQQINQQQHLEKETKDNLNKIQQALSTANNELKLMSSMVATKKSAQKVLNISHGEESSNALSRIAERKKKLATEVIKSKVVAEMSKKTTSQTLEEKTHQALGKTNNNAGQKKLAEIRKRISQQ